MPRKTYTPKQELAAYYYVFGHDIKGDNPIDGTKMNAEAAMIAAGYSKTYARSRAGEFIGKCRQLVDELSEPVKTKLVETAEDLFAMFQRVLDSDLSDFFEDSVLLDDDRKPIINAFTGKPLIVQRMKPFNEIPKELRQLIEQLKYDKNGNPEIKLIPKTKIMELTGRYFKMFTDRVELDGDVTQNVIRVPEKKPVGAPVD